MIEVNLLPESQKKSRGKAKRAAGGGGGLGQALKGRNLWNGALTVACVVVPAATGVIWWGQRTDAASFDVRLEAATKMIVLMSMRMMTFSFTVVVEGPHDSHSE